MTSIAPTKVERIPRHREPRRIPMRVRGDHGLVVVDATWGMIQPIRLPGGVETVGELEVIAHIERNGCLVDTRRDEYVEQGTLPGAVAIAHDEIVQGLDEIDPDGVVILFCNGPQCTATPQAIAQLLEAGWRPETLRYYRGGIHDWITLGLPLKGDD